MPRYYSEMTVRVWDNECDCFFEIAPDKDGLGMIYLKYVEPNTGVDPESFPAITFDIGAVPFLIKALQQVVSNKEE